VRTIQTIDYSEAKRAIDLIVEKTLQMQKAVSIAVADSHGDVICFARMDGAPVSSIRIAMNKAWTAARERKPTPFETWRGIFSSACSFFVTQITFWRSLHDLMKNSVATEGDEWTRRTVRAAEVPDMLPSLWTSAASPMAWPLSE
jgi:hypothetical protein